MTDDPTRIQAIDDAAHMRRAFDLLVAGLFVLALVTPVVGMWVETERASELVENRRLAPLPGAPDPGGDLLQWIDALPGLFDAWYADHFGFRSRLIEWNTLVSVLWLDGAPQIGSLSGSDPRSFIIDPLARTVLKGRDDWYYSFGPGLLDDHRGLSPMTRDELLHWQAMLENRQRDLALRGIDYLFVVVPEKQTVYPEHLPEAIVRHGPTRAQQLVEHLRAHSSVQLLDLRPVLDEAKKEQQTYYRTGTHWTDFGALRAAQAILARLAPRHPGLSIPSDADFVPRAEDGPGRPFLGLVGLRTRVPESYVFLDPRRDRLARDVGDRERGAGPGGRRYWSYLARTTGQSGLPRAVVIHDSFTSVGLEPILSEHFASVAYHWRPDFSWAEIAPDRPDVVIEEHAERYFVRPLRSAANESR